MEKELMTIATENHSIGHTSRITTITVATVRYRTVNTREFYVLLDTGCSSSGKLEELSYMIIIGWDLLQTLKVVINFEY